jgi:DNA-binding response OmpR family regulator
MSLTSPFDTVRNNDEDVVLAGRLESASLSERITISQGSLRFGGLTMDARTGLTHWRGRMLELSLDERELLGILLHHAGQILSIERLAVLLGQEMTLVEAHITLLSVHLKQEGVTCLPRRATGLGYVLWRS